MVSRRENQGMGKAVQEDLWFSCLSMDGALRFVDTGRSLDEYGDDHGKDGAEVPSVLTHRRQSRYPKAPDDTGHYGDY